MKKSETIALHNGIFMQRSESLAPYTVIHLNHLQTK